MTGFGDNESMSDFRFPVAPSYAAQELQHLVDQLRTALEPVVDGQGRVVRHAPHVDEEDFSQDILVSSPFGQVEVAVCWDKSASEAAVSVSSGGGSRQAYLPLVLGFAAAFLADRTPELLPIFRGLRVVLGVLVGTLVGLLVLAVMAAFAPRRPRGGERLEARVERAVRQVLSQRAASPVSAWPASAGSEQCSS